MQSAIVVDIGHISQQRAQWQKRLNFTDMWLLKLRLSLCPQTVSFLYDL
jgi:hypothetical protein